MANVGWLATSVRRLAIYSGRYEDTFCRLFERTTTLSPSKLRWTRPLVRLPWSCFMQGLIITLTGVALLDLVEIYDSDIASVSHLITTRCVGGLLGSLVGGKLYDAYNVQIVSILMMVVTCVTVLMIPLSGSLALSHAMVFFGAISSFAFDIGEALLFPALMKHAHSECPLSVLSLIEFMSNGKVTHCLIASVLLAYLGISVAHQYGANVWIIRIWPENSNPPLQAYHLAFGAGCAVAPLITDPFISSGVGRETLNQTANLTEDLFNESGYIPFEPFLNKTVSGKHYGGESRVYYSFGIVSAFHLLLVIAMVVSYFIDSSDVKSSQGGKPVPSETEYVFFSRSLLVLLSVYLCVYVALECTTSQMLTAYAVKSDLHFTKSEAAHLAAVYFSCFAASRLVAALTTIKISPFQMLVLSHVILVVTGTVLLVWGSRSAPMLWACSALMGISQAPLYAAVVAWTVSYIHFSNVMMSVVIFVGDIGTFSPSLLVGQFLDSSPNQFLYVCFVSVLLCATFFVATYSYVRKRPLLNVERESVNLE